MRNLPDRRAEQGSHVELRSTTPQKIIEYVDRHFDEKVWIEFGEPGKPIVLPRGWHGEGRSCEALVHVGDVLTIPISGTKLAAENFISWTKSEGFDVFDSQNRQIDIRDASSLLQSSYVSTKRGEPIVRLTRTSKDGVPVEIHFYAGGTNDRLKTLSKIGNRNPENVTLKDRAAYREAVHGLFEPFISKGSRQERLRMGIDNPNTISTVDILRRIDDCAASLVTIIGDQVMDDKMSISRENLMEIVDVSVGTLQAVIVAIYMANRRHVPLLMRIGAPAFGLGKETGLNYMMNTLLEMRACGSMVVGDMGTLMDEGEASSAQPSLHHVRRHDVSREIRFYLGGGVPVQRILEEDFKLHGKPLEGWDMAVRRAFRADHGLTEWAVGLSGTQLTVRAKERRGKVFLRPGTKLVDGDGYEITVNDLGLWCSPEPVSDNRIKVSYVDRNKGQVDLYQLLPE